MRRSLASLIPAWIACCALAEIGPAQTALWSRHGSGIFDQVGSSVAGVGDLDGDGYADFAFGAIQDARLSGKGYVRVYSGRTGDLLQAWSGDAVGDGFGVSIASPGDLDLDGTPDVVVGATPTAKSVKTGYVRVFSGATGKVIRTLRGDSAGDLFGVSLAGLGDVNGDKLPTSRSGRPSTSSAPRSTPGRYT